MTWKEFQRKGSFRGIPFEIRTSQAPSGRKVVQHEFPNRDDTYPEDKGKAPKVYDIEGYVIGTDYHEKKKALETAFDQKGPGELIHPYCGSLIVVVGPVNFNESNTEGGIATFVAKFYPADAGVFPKSDRDKAAEMADSSDAALSEIKRDFDENFSIAGLPAFAVDTSRDLINNSQGVFNKTVKLLSNQADAVAGLAFSTRNLAAEANDLLQAPSNLSQRLLDSFQLLEDSFTDPKEKASAHSEFFTFGDDTPDIIGETPTRDSQRENKDIFKNFMKRASSVKAANAAISGDYLTISEATNRRDSILEVIESQMEETDSNDVFQALMQVKSDLIDSLPDVDDQLPNLKVITTSRMIDSINFSYENFEDLSKESGIISRNNISHPAFIPEETEIEVIDDRS